MSLILGENTVFYITDVKKSLLERELKIFVIIMGVSSMNKITDQAIDKIYELAIGKKYDEMMDELEKLPRRAVDVLIRKMIAEKGEDYTDKFFYDTMEGFGEENDVSIEQLERWKWLNSTQREREYLMSISEEDMTDQDWFDLRATDF